MVDQSREKNLTIKILIDYFNDLEKPGQHLKALISISQISIQIETLDYNLPVLELITSFYYLLIQNKENYDRFSNFFNKEFDKYIRRKEKRTKYSNLMAQERQQTPLHSSKYAVTIDYHTLIMYDLEIFQDVLTKEFAKTKQGIIAFNIIENPDILKFDQVFTNYIIKRIQKELDLMYDNQEYRGSPMEKMCHLPIYIKLPCSYESVEKTIENHLKDLLETPHLDIIFVVQYDSMDKSQLNSTAQNFLKIVKNNYSHYFQEMRYLIIIFASVYCECHLENFIPLPVPNKFDIHPQSLEDCPLTKWFKDVFLKRNKVEPQNQSLYINRLRDIIINHQGDLIQTYQRFQSIFEHY